MSKQFLLRPQSWKFGVWNSHPRSPKVRPRLEPMEAREVPAGNVTAVLASGTLTITGVDDLSDAGVLNGLNNNKLTLQGSGAGNFTVLGIDTTTVNGNANEAFTGVTDIKFDLRAGNDEAEFLTGNLAGAVTYTGGGGKNRLQLNANAGTQQFGAVTFNGNDGNDTLIITNGKSIIANALTIAGGNGNNVVQLNAFATDELKVGGVSVTNGDGNDAFTVLGKNLIVTNGMTINNGTGDSVSKIIATTISFGGPLTVTNLEGTDDFTLGEAAGTVTGKAVTIKNGAGNTNTKLSAATHTLTGNFAVTNGAGSDQYTINGVTIAGNVNLVNGNGGVSANITGANSKFTGNLSVTNGTGFESIQSTGAKLEVTGAVTLDYGNGGSQTKLINPISLIVGGPLKVTGGFDADTFTLGATGGTATLGAVTIKNGAGNNTVTFAADKHTIGGNATITNGSGVDVVTLGALALTGNLAISNGTGGSTVALVGGDTKITGNLSLINGSGVDKITTFCASLEVTGGITVVQGTEDSTTDLRPGGKLTVGGPISIKSCADTDNVTIESDNNEASLHAITIDNGAGFNSTTISANTNLTVVGNVSITGKDGFDTVTITADVLGKITGNVAINHGPGGGLVSLNGSVQVTGNLALTALDGSESLTTNGTALVVGGTTKLNFGNGGLNVQLNTATNDFGGAIVISGGEGQNTVSFSKATTCKAVTFTSGTGSAADLRFDAPTIMTGNLTYKSQDGDDEFDATDQLDVTGTVTIDAGAGDDNVDWGGPSSSVTGTLLVKTGTGNDTIKLKRLTVGGATTIETGALNDTIEIDDCTFNNTMAINAGADDDIVRIDFVDDSGVKTTFAKATTFNLGAGDDVLEIGRIGDVNDFAEFLAAVIIDGGAGLDIGRFLPVASGGTRNNLFSALPVPLGVEAVV